MTEPTAVFDAVKAQASIDLSGYDKAVAELRTAADALLAEFPNRQVYVVDTPSLYANYLDVVAELAPERRQEHTCTTCNQFITRTGRAVFIESDGSLRSLFWNPDVVTDPFYREVVSRLRDQVINARVNGLFSHENNFVLSQKAALKYSHFTLGQRVSYFNNLPYHTDGVTGMLAALEQQVPVLRDLLRKYNQMTFETAGRLIKNDTILRAQKLYDHIDFLISAKRKMVVKENGHVAWNNHLWSIATTAPAGFCSGSGMMGALLDDIANNLSMDQVIARHNHRADPSFYQRPKREATDKLIDLAEKIIADLGVAESLKRRHASVVDLRPLWVPRVKEDAAAEESAQSKGVFGALRRDTNVMEVTKAVTTGDGVDRGNLTWNRFLEKVLPNAVKIEMMVSPQAKIPTGLYTTAVNPDAPPILQWDRVDARNPVCGYTYNAGTDIRFGDLGVIAGGWREIYAIVPDAPRMYGEPVGEPLSWLKHHVLLLSGLTPLANTGLALFPETLRSELHPIRTVIENYSASNQLAAPAEGEVAIGYRITVGSGHHILTLRVTLEDGTRVRYTVDRWED